jgi:hypothetical protein
MEGLLIIAILCMIAGYETAAMWCVAPVFLFIACAILHLIYTFTVNLIKRKA